MTTTDWRSTVTGETITDEQIRDFALEAGAHGDDEAVTVCCKALGGDSAARAEVAEMYRAAWAAE